MIGGIIGDFVGSVFEERKAKGNPFRTYNLEEKFMFSHLSRITDDSILLTATAECLLDDSDDFESYYKKWAHRYPDAGYGPGFSLWLSGDSDEYTSFGNGAAARAGVLGYLDNEKDVLDLARKSALVSHKHPEGVNGALAMAWVVWALRKGNISVKEICQELYAKYDYYVDYNLTDLQKDMAFDCSAVNTVPIAIYLALKGTETYENCIRTCMWVGGDTDTIMAMAGLIKAQEYTISLVWERTVKQWMWKNAQCVLQVNERFERRFDMYPNLPF